MSGRLYYVPFTAVGSELLFDEWTSVFASERLTRALSEVEGLDRMTHHVHILEMNGDSYRLASSRKRQKLALKTPEEPIMT